MALPIRLRQPAFRQVLAFAVAVAAFAACEHGPTEPTTPIGDYNMSTINGGAMPFTMFADGAYKYEVASGTLTVGADGKFISRTNSRETVDGHISLYVDSTYGTWSQPTTGTLVFLSLPDSSTQSGSWQGFRVTFAIVDGTTTTTVVYSRK
jgi:hypothetical protein